MGTISGQAIARAAAAETRENSSSKRGRSITTLDRTWQQRCKRTYQSTEGQRTAWGTRRGNAIECTCLKVFESGLNHVQWTNTSFSRFYSALAATTVASRTTVFRVRLHREVCVALVSKRGVPTASSGTCRKSQKSARGTVVRRFASRQLAPYREESKGRETLRGNRRVDRVRNWSDNRRNSSQAAGRQWTHQIRASP